MSTHTNPNPSMDPPSQTMQERFPARRRTLASLRWACVNYFQKKRIAWEDRSGWFGYDKWIKTVEPAQIQKLVREAGKQLSSSTAIGFVVCGGDVSPALLENTLQSLQNIKTSWSLSVFLPRRDQQFEEGVFQHLFTGEERLRIIPVDEPAFPWDWALDATQIICDWLVPLRAGDILSQRWYDAFNVYKARFPNADILYWDEDTRLDTGKRDRPLFKPDWSPELLYSNNYLDSAAFHKSLLPSTLNNQLGSTAGYLFTAVNAARHIAHIPFILQHRSPITDKALQDFQNQYAASVVAALENLGCQEVRVTYAPVNHKHIRADALVQPPVEPFERVLRATWKPQPALVSIIIPTRNNPGYLKRCIHSLVERTQGVAYEVILMDDHSSDSDTLKYYADLETQRSEIRLHHNQGDFNYSRVNNQGAHLAKGDLLLFLNNDVEILDSSWLAEMVRWAQLPGVGMVGAKLLYPDRTIQHAGIVLGMTGHAGHIFAGRLPEEASVYLSAEVYRNVSAVTGACMLVRREAFEQAGGFDENLMLVFNDVDLCVRLLNNGWRIVYTPAASLIHFEGVSRSRYMPPDDIRLGAQRLSDDIARGDRYYSPNLSLAVNWPTFRRSYEPGALNRLRQIVNFKG